jgi:putative FmdB family regulatory protein
MPTYEYQCPACGVVEAVQSMRDPALTKCPQCHKRKVTRIISGGGGVIFRGDGFWETDYNRSKDYGSKKKAESGGEAPAAPAAGKPAGEAAPAPAKAAPPTPKPAAEASKATKGPTPKAGKD